MTPQRPGGNSADDILKQFVYDEIIRLRAAVSAGTFTSNLPRGSHTRFAYPLKRDDPPEEEDEPET